MGPRCLTIEWEEEETWTAGSLRILGSGFRAWAGIVRHSGGHVVKFIALGGGLSGPFAERVCLGLVESLPDLRVGQ